MHKSSSSAPPGRTSHTHSGFLLLPIGLRYFVTVLLGIGCPDRTHWRFVVWPEADRLREGPAIASRRFPGDRNAHPVCIWVENPHLSRAFEKAGLKLLQV